MEEKIDPLKETNGYEEGSFKKESSTTNSEKEQSQNNNLNPIEDDSESKNQTKTSVPNNDINNANSGVSVKNNSNKEIVEHKIGTTEIKDINKLKDRDGSESSTIPKIKPKKELPIEKKPFNEFINDHLFPSLIKEFNEREFEVAQINLKNTSRPIAGDKCWVVFFEIKDICNFWLSFEKDDISSLKSISLCKPNQRPSVIESFLIDEKRITLKLIISRILQRLNGQKLIGIN